VLFFASITFLSFQIRNCRQFNDDNSPYVACANGLEKVINELFNSKDAHPASSSTAGESGSN
jgi:hypothetical protein